ncbi:MULTISPECIES: TIGR01440 family protein [unclassified Fictibacillus]|uniref:TIGR01440 family protein n=1 Tax=unclassified Fictibacillus TaxID=2644029 RepID=UPI0006A7D097|nr:MULTISPECIES: TIGR01440 family protein [unclassified Fictibacillus]MED2970883.1 TIGR01440 family protein [Fictibacillus sp. B-59209]UZJ79171.1 TIGR01440 family protein [Fictibacillus sp. KU28468]SFE85045.1 TIGR01440 family protein [Bacillus sp. OV194]
MSDQLQTVEKQVFHALSDLQKQAQLKPGQLLVVGASTSEVTGGKIGTSGTMEAAQALYNGVKTFQEESQVALAFQCCEHLNRALVMEREIADRLRYEEVRVVPARSAGGALATYAFHHLNDPVVVEYIKADAGIDIGDTFIGMHLKHVAVPVRTEVKSIGEAHVTLAKTRPKLIGGERAVYPSKEDIRCF